VLPAVKACFQALFALDTSPWFDNIHLSDELTFDIFKPEALNCFCQLYTGLKGHAFGNALLLTYRSLFIN